MSYVICFFIIIRKLIPISFQHIQCDNNFFSFRELNKALVDANSAIVTEYIQSIYLP